MGQETRRVSSVLKMRALDRGATVPSAPWCSVWAFSSCPPPEVACPEVCPLLMLRVSGLEMLLSSTTSFFTHTGRS